MWESHNLWKGSQEKATSRQGRGDRGAIFCWTFAPKNFQEPSLPRMSRKCKFLLNLCSQEWHAGHQSEWQPGATVAYHRCHFANLLRKRRSNRVETFPPKTVKQAISHSWNEARQLRAQGVIPQVQSCNSWEQSTFHSIWSKHRETIWYDSCWNCDRFIAFLYFPN